MLISAIFIITNNQTWNNNDNSRNFIFHSLGFRWPIWLVHKKFMKKFSKSLKRNDVFILKISSFIWYYVDQWIINFQRNPSISVVDTNSFWLQNIKRIIFYLLLNRWVWHDSQFDERKSPCGIFNWCLSTNQENYICK